MKIIIIICALFITPILHAQGCIYGDRPSEPHYICFDGRSVEKSALGLIWHAKRGCFLSSVPCCNYEATHYAYYSNPSKIGKAYARCRHDYPFRLGYMQMH